MKFLRFFVFTLPFIIPSPSYSQNTNDITNPDTGTFPINEKYGHPQKAEEDQQLEMQREEENLDRPRNDRQLEMQREEEELDSFGNDKYNENVDQDTLNEVE